MVPAILFLVLFLAACLVLSTRLTRRHHSVDSLTPSDLGLEFRSVYFPSADGLTLYGWWIPAGDSPRTVIFLHGFSTGIGPDLKHARVFHDAGFNVFMFDFRAHGRSGGNLTSIGALEVQDVLGAYDFVRSCNSWSVGLMGYSMGGRTALLAAAANKGFDAVVSDGGPLRLHTAVTEFLHEQKIPGVWASILAGMALVGASIRLAVNLFWRDPLPQARKIPPTPVLLIHGDLDKYTRISELEKMVAKTRGQIKLWRVANARHCEVDLADPVEYHRRVVEFFDRNMKHY